LKATDLDSKTGHQDVAADEKAEESLELEELESLDIDELEDLDRKPGDTAVYGFYLGSIGGLKLATFALFAALTAFCGCFSSGYAYADFMNHY
jgi:hypothetical protein